MKHYLGGYYLIRLTPKGFGNQPDSLLHTCSYCFNQSLVDVWSYSWTADNDRQVEGVKESLQLSDSKIDSIRSWVDTMHIEKKLGWVNAFTDLETVMRYKELFFSDLEDVKLMAIYFSEAERDALIEEFRPQPENQGEIGLRLTSRKAIEETESDRETLLGFDYIGIDIGGDFHTFHCHDLGEKLCSRFQLQLNAYGIFDAHENTSEVLDYLNDQENGYEPVPWFVAKVKLVGSLHTTNA